ncbi:hypothetical protein E1N52_31865 [Paraburkholderia guartelaensis]|uniref:Uncharacterized protein n=1 Tax=Paraburkholderia guartelaensis TaxID=2546446 RepID=A0A4R5L7D5_9BURK|nr:hypothetical protein [Paraburkholderia guartelaensis]TDG03970.1 hypothetical protein E1N52_31865 [Paraburkholderia guartelaensis]
MNTAEMSLRSIVEKWFAPTLTTTLRVTRFSHARCAYGRYVRVEASREEGNTIALCFFRHADGAWRVFPPDPRRANHMASLCLIKQ